MIKRKVFLSIVAVAVFLPNYISFAEQKTYEFIPTNLPQEIKDRIKSAGENCKKSADKAQIEVSHKYCGKNQEEQKKKNGKTCQVSGLQGGSIKAICSWGCCVAVSVSSAGDKSGSGDGVNYSGSANNGNTATGPYGSGQGGQGFMQSFMQLMQGFMQGGGGNDSTGYSPPTLPDINEPKVTVVKDDITIDTDDTDDTDEDGGDDVYNEIESETNDVMRGAKNEDGGTRQDSGETVINSKRNERVEIKTDAGIKKSATADRRYTFVNNSSSNEYESGLAQDTDSDGYMAPHTMVRNHRGNTSGERDASVTGFKSDRRFSEKNNNQSIFGLIINFIQSLFTF